MSRSARRRAASKAGGPPGRALRPRRRPAAGVAGAAALVALVATAGTATATTTYRGAAVDDPQMAIEVNRAGRAVEISYENVLVGCSNGERVRQAGASHDDLLGAERRFRDVLEAEGVTSLVKGRVRSRRVSGFVSYDLAYEGGQCRSGKVRFEARRVEVADRASGARRSQDA